jgi:hypothetical protein
MLNIDKEIFNKNLLITQYYCQLQLLNTEKNNASIFRSYNPKYNGETLFRFQLLDYGLEPEVKYCFLAKWNVDPTEKVNALLIKELFDMQMEYKKSVFNDASSGEGFTGKILISQPDETVIDGASAVASGGLIDDFDCPPIDTWFYYTKNPHGKLLFSWIPREFVAFANKAVLVNCVECIDWFEHAFPEDSIACIRHYEKFRKMKSKKLL